MQVIKPQIIQMLKLNSKAKYRLSYEFNVHTNTIDRWIANNEKGEVSPLLTMQGLKALSEELGVKKSELTLS